MKWITICVIFRAALGDSPKVEQTTLLVHFSCKIMFQHVDFLKDLHISHFASPNQTFTTQFVVVII